MTLVKNLQKISVIVMYNLFVTNADIYLLL